MNPVAPLDALTRAVAHTEYSPSVPPEEYAEKLVAHLAAAGYRIEPDPTGVEPDLAVADLVAWLLERRAEFGRQATNAPRDSVEQLASRDTADALGEVAHAITERWVKQ